MGGEVVQVGIDGKIQSTVRRRACRQGQEGIDGRQKEREDRVVHQERDQQSQLDHEGAGETGH